MTDYSAMGTTEPMSQSRRVPCSLPLLDADLSAGNANWTRGLQAMSEWIWSGNLNPAAFPNNLGRFFLQIPGVFEQQLNYSTTLIFDEASFKNGVQISGMLPRTLRELAISLIAQRRRCWYSMTHHALLGKLTAQKHGLSDEVFGHKWSQLDRFAQHADAYSPLEREVLAFTDSFATNPKAYSDGQCAALRQHLREHNVVHVDGRSWTWGLQAARGEYAASIAKGSDPQRARDVARAASLAATRRSPTDEELEQLINAQIVELAFLCLQFVALTGVFTALNVPDEGSFGEVLKSVVPAAVIARTNELNELGSEGMAELVPPPVQIPLQEILAGEVQVDPVALRGTRIPLEPYELNASQGTRDRGLALGGVQVGVYGWSFGSHFPGSLVYALMHHPELARYETAYSLPVLFNDDEWRNGVQTAGFVPWRFKEVVYQKVYRTLRSRYGIEHHTMFLLNALQQEHGAGPFRLPSLSDSEAERARGVALQRANAIAVFARDHRSAPSGVFTRSESAAMDWVESLVCTPHGAVKHETALRAALDESNRGEVDIGTRRLDTSGRKDKEEAFRALLDHQVAELAMTAGHMDGLGRLLTILRLESEAPVQSKTIGPDGAAQPTGYFQDRPGLLDILKYLGMADTTATAGELLLNPQLNARVKQRLASGERSIRVSAEEASVTAEF